MSLADEDAVKKDCFKNGDSAEDGETFVNLYRAQKKQGDMQPLNKLPAYCMCSSVNCTFQDSNFLADSFTKLMTESKELKELKEAKATTPEGQLLQVKLESVQAEKD